MAAKRTTHSKESGSGDSVKGRRDEVRWGLGVHREQVWGSGN